MQVKIINGSYGYHPEGAAHTVAVSRGELCDVTPEEAERLVNSGVAVIIDAPGVATPQGGDSVGIAPSYLDPEQLATMTNAELKALAEDLGLPTGKLKNKTQLIEAITSAEDIPGNEDDAEDLPDISAEDPLV